MRVWVAFWSCAIATFGFATLCLALLAWDHLIGAACSLLAASLTWLAAAVAGTHRPTRRNA